MDDVEIAEAREILSLLVAPKRQKMVRMLEYDEDSAASLMNTDFMVIQDGTSIAEATRKLIKNVKYSDFIAELFVIDSEQKYLGSIELKKLLAARKGDILDEITECNQTVIYELDAIHTSIRKLRD